MYEEILNSLIWSYTKANASLLAIINTRTPANSEDLRLHYGIYIESILSAVDHMKDCKYLSDSDIYGVVLEDDFQYFRELRNSIVHRGFNVCAEATIENNFIYFRTPQKVINRNKKLIRPPKEQFIILFLLKVDNLIRNLIHSKIQNFDLLQYKEVAINDLFDGLSVAIKENQHIPQNIKKLFFDNQENVKSSIKPKEMHDSLVSKYHDVVLFKDVMENLNVMLKAGND